MWLILLCTLAYIIGSIPTSIIAGRLLRNIDIREHGSRNPGATNTFRVLGKKIGIGVGLIDIFKGFAAVWFLPRLLPAGNLSDIELRMILAGVAVVAGHVWTIFASFRGGKGVGTSFGVLIGLAPFPSVVVLIIWCSVTFGTGYVSLGSIVAATALPITVAIQGLVCGNLSTPILIVSIVLAALVVIRHKSNIVRLIRGEENRFGKRGDE